MSLIIILGIVAIFLGFIIYGKIASQEWQKENRGQYTIGETEHFIGTYFNPDDSIIFVPKQTGGGYTISFANPISIIAGLLVIGGFIALILITNPGT